MHFGSPLWLLLFLPLIALIMWRLKKPVEKSSLTFSDVSGMKGFQTWKAKYINLGPQIIRWTAIALCIIAISRPQSILHSEKINAKGIDIVLCIDTSGSMKAVDFKPKNRLDAAKDAAVNFIKARKYDRIGLVVFGGIALTQCPLTLDYSALFEFLGQVEIGMTKADMTAIGTAIATSVNRLKDSAAKSKVIILLTDGRNNAGEIDPVTAARAANAFGIKIYTIGAGKPGEALYPVDHPLLGRRYMKIPDELDENTLIKVARVTGGQYFRAKSAEGLKEIYGFIDRMEKSDLKIKEFTNYKDLYIWFLLVAIMLILADWIASSTVFRIIP